MLTRKESPTDPEIIST